MNRDVAIHSVGALMSDMIYDYGSYRWVRTDEETGEWLCRVGPDSEAVIELRVGFTHDSSILYEVEVLAFVEGGIGPIVIHRSVKFLWESAITAAVEWWEQNGDAVVVGLDTLCDIMDNPGQWFGADQVCGDKGFKVKMLVSLIDMIQGRENQDQEHMEGE